MLGESQGALMEASDGAVAGGGLDHAYVYPLKVRHKVLCLCTLFPNVPFISQFVLVYCFPQVATGWTSAAFCPDHTIAMQISSE